MRFFTTRRGLQQPWVPLLGILCVALVLFTGILSVAHTHPGGHFDPDCSLCLTAHHVAQAVVVVVVEMSSQPVARYVADDFHPLPRQRFVLKLANRPPPSAPAFA